MLTLLLTGARAPVTLDLARALKKAGHRVIGVDSVHHALSRRSNAFDSFCVVTAPNDSFEQFRSELISICKLEKVDIVIPTCEEAFHVSRAKKELETVCRVWVDRFEKLSILHSKYEFNRLIHELELPAPITYRARNASEAEAAIHRLAGRSVVLKPEFSRFATQAMVLEKPAALARLPDLKISDDRAWVAQEALLGPEYCTYTWVDRGHLIAHVIYEHDFTAGGGAGICFRAVEIPAITDWIRKFCKITEYHGQIAFDFIVDRDGVAKPLECNPRATSGLHLLTANPDFLQNILNDRTEKKLTTPVLGAEAQIRLAMIAYGLPSIRSAREARNWLRIFTRARETVFSWNDFLPFLDQFGSFYSLIRGGLKNRMTALEFSTRDIEFNGTLPAQPGLKVMLPAESAIETRA